VAHDDDAAGALSAAIDLRDRVKGDPPWRIESRSVSA
jgi:hypothetical protein